MLYLVSALVLCLFTAKPVLVSIAMVNPADIKAALNEVLDVKLVSISADINQVKAQLSSNLSDLKIDQDKKLEDLDKKWEERFGKMEENQRKFQNLSISGSGGGRIGSVTLVNPNLKPAKTASSKPVNKEEEQQSQSQGQIQLWSHPLAQHKCQS